MLRIPHLVPVLLLAAGALPAQTAAQRTVQAQGTGMVTAQPDQAQFTAAVVTQGSTAQEAAQQNATLTTAVIAALKSKLGTSGMVQTISYSVSPRYGNPPSSAITGYIATNTLMVTSFDLNLVGALIDTANLAGANSVGGVTFGLQDSSPQMQQALTSGAKQALANAGAIAAGLGGKAGAVISAQQGGIVAPFTAVATAGASASTPIQSGPVTVSANVTVMVELVQ
jgi:uncharacterized protein